MNSSQKIIKLKKIDNKTWVAPSTKYLSEINVTNTSCGYRIMARLDYCLREIGYARTQKGVISLLNDFDLERDNERAKELEEHLAYEAEIQARKEKEKEAQFTYANSAKTEPTPIAGTFSFVKFSNQSKGTTLGASVYQCNLPQDNTDDKYWNNGAWVTPKHWMITKVFIKAVLLLTDKQYDALSLNTVDTTVCAECGITKDMGGNESTYKVDREKYPNNEFIYNATEQEFNAWKAESWTIVAAITAPNRRTFYVDTQGYNYARYIGIEA